MAIFLPLNWYIGIIVTMFIIGGIQLVCDAMFKNVRRKNYQNQE